MLYNNINDKKIAIPYSNLNATDYPSSQYTPIGVVVIPSSHDVYGTGECGIMSLVNMSTSTPDKGDIEQLIIIWGNSDEGINLPLPDLERVPLISSTLTSNEITGVADYGYLPSTKVSGNKPSVGNGLDTTAGYNSSSYIPSPYLEDGSRNPSYYTTDTSKYPGLSANCLSDFDGIGNTNVILAAATGQTDWRTASSITNTDRDYYFPAACCTWRFHTSGTSQGDWYLPAMGELGYMIARFNEIQTALNKVKSIYGSSFVCLLDAYNGYWSSSEYSSASAMGLEAVTGGVFWVQKNNNFNVRAFFRT